MDDADIDIAIRKKLVKAFIEGSSVTTGFYYGETRFYKSLDLQQYVYLSRVYIDVFGLFCNLIDEGIIANYEITVKGWLLYG